MNSTIFSSKRPVKREQQPFTMTDALEREFLAQRPDYFNDVPLESFGRWVATGVKTLVGKVKAAFAAESADLSRAHK